MNRLTVLLLAIFPLLVGASSYISKEDAKPAQPEKNEVVEFYLNGKKVRQQLPLNAEGELKAVISDSSIIYKEGYPVKLKIALTNGYVSFNSWSLEDYKDLSDEPIENYLEQAQNGHKLVFGFTNTEPAVRISFTLR